MSYQAYDFNVFSLNVKVLDSMNLLYFDSSLNIRDPPKHEDKICLSSDQVKEQRENFKSTASTCLICAISIDSTTRDTLSKHYKSEWHIQNLRRSIKSLAPLSLSDFEKRAYKDESEEESGVESSDEYTSDEDNDIKNSSLKLDPIYEKMEALNFGSNEGSVVSFTNTRSPYIYFASPEIPKDKVLGAYKSLFNNDELNDPLGTIKSWNQHNRSKPMSAILMLGSGHFAGAVISHIPKNPKSITSNSKIIKPEDLIEIIVSKTFHRYTTRRKQGGAQNANDNSKGKANSAGSSIRRYNEQVLIKEVRELLNEWKDLLNNCVNIYVRANGSMRNILIGYDGCILSREDQRIKNLSFTTKRPTVVEIKRSWTLLAYLHVLDPPNSLQEENDKAQRQKKLLELSKVQKEPVKPAKENNADVIHSEKLAMFIKRSKAPLLVTYLRKNGISSNFQLVPKELYPSSPTLLHYASSHGCAHIVEVLLNHLQADPTFKNNANQTAFELASDKQTKRTFQIARYTLGEEYCDWGMAKVGKPKSKAAFEAEDEQEKQRVDSINKKTIQDALNSKTELELKKPSVSSSGKLLGADFNKHVQLSGLTEEQKIRLSREERARAAEARIKKMQGK